MAELVGGAFLSATLQVLFDRLASREVINFFRGRNHGDRLLRKLKLKLHGLNAVLNDAEDKQITNPAVKDWLEELKDAVYHADDLLDEIATEALRCKVEAEYPSGSNQVPAPILIPTSSFYAEIESKLEKTIDSLEEFAKEINVLGLREGVGQNWSQRLPTTSLVDETGVYGRQKDKKKIMKLLLSDGEKSNKIDVIPIVGMGGVGKTTLAQLLYNDSRVDKQFQMKAWVCVSDVFNVFSITRTILQAVSGQTCDAEDLNLLQVKLKESLSGKKFLVVLDDVWNQDYDNWDKLMSPFKYGGHGSRVIITTRNEAVASLMRTVPIHGLRGLQDEDCWMLFAGHAFDNGDCSAHPDLEQIGRQIVKKCQGSPLAAKTLASLVRGTRDVKDWISVLKSSIWDLSEEKSKILPALKLSYHYLPSHLKRCFASCSIFPQDYQFDQEELVLFWIAIGIVEKAKSNKTIEEEGYECFRELLSRSFFQRSSADTSRFVMHDLLNDLAQFVSGDFCYRLEEDKPHRISAKARHFSKAQCIFDGFENFKILEEAKFLRTFISLKSQSDKKQWFSRKVLEEILPKLTRLRLLSLSKYQIFELPHSIGNLIHLRYLDLSDTPIKQLPESVCSLYNLQTLLLSNCRLLTTLPEEIGKLISLSHLDLSGTNLKEMPMQMSQLKDLQVLTTFIVGKRQESGISQLKEFRHLHGTISISGLQNVSSGREALEAKLKEKEHLEKLVLEWGGTTEDSQIARDVLDKLQPNTNLKHLQIKHYGGTSFPNWLGDQAFCNMVSLSLENCEYCFSLPSLGQLPSLKELTIARMKVIKDVGSEFYGESSHSSTPFQSLKMLHFEEMPEWVDWHILDAGEFPQLKKLEITNCPKLIGNLPKDVPSLVSLQIKECPELVASLPRAPSTRKLVLGNCSRIELGLQGVSSAETLQISDFDGLKELTSLLSFPLTRLYIRNCPSLESFPDTGLPPMLTRLSIEDCNAMKSFSEGMMRLNNLKDLTVLRCPNLVFSISEEMRHCYTSITDLFLRGCDSLKSLPLDLFPLLRHLTIDDCENIETLSNPNGVELQNLASLESVFIDRCDDMVSFPRGGLPAPKLSRFIISRCKKLKALPEQMHTLLPSLQSLDLSHCPEIECFPEGGLPSKLRFLSIWFCGKLVGRRRDWGLQTLPSLTHCLIGGGGSEDGVVESFPEEGLLPFTLTSLSIKDMRNLKSLNNRGLQYLGSLKHMRIEGCDQLLSLPEEEGLLPSTITSLHISDMRNLKSLNNRGLQHLGSLKYMGIQGCHQLRSLPEEEGLPTSLFFLEILDCPLLKAPSSSGWKSWTGSGQKWLGVREEAGYDLRKIAARIPFLHVEGEVIFDQVYLGPFQERKYEYPIPCVMDEFFDLFCS